MQMISQALLVTTLIAGTFCQKIVFDNSTLISPCTTGARSEIDRYIITGTIEGNITELLIQKWLPFVFILIFRTSSLQFGKVCEFRVGGRTCDPTPAPECKCFYNTATDQAHFTANTTVQAADGSNGVIYAQWEHRNGTTIYSNKNYTLPEIYDVSAAHLTLNVAGVTGNLTKSGSCSLSLTLSKSNDLQLCCSKTAKPCYPQIAFNGTVVTNNTETCVTYSTFQLASDGVTGNLDLSYSMCTQTGNRQGSSCSVIAKLADVTSSPPDVTVSAESWDDNLCQIICPAIIVPIILFIIIVAVCCYQSKKKSQAVSSQGTHENAEKEQTSEHREKDSIELKRKKLSGSQHKKKSLKKKKQRKTTHP